MLHLMHVGFWKVGGHLVRVLADKNDRASGEGREGSQFGKLPSQSHAMALNAVTR